MKNTSIQNNETNGQTYVMSRIYNALNDEESVFADICEGGLVLLTVIEGETICECGLGEHPLSLSEQKELQRLLKLAFAA